MPLPKAERVVYKVNPLNPVICQVRFPPILQISAKEPVEFQEAIRSKFPAYEHLPPGGRELPSQLPPELTQLISRAFGPAPHKFSSKDGKRFFVLAQDSLSYTDRDYERWEQFTSVVFPALEHLNRIYEPNEYTRVGLRYVNMVSRSELGLSDVPWSELLQPTILGAMSDPQFGDLVTATEGQFEATVQEVPGSTVKVRYGLVPDNSRPTEGKPEQVFKIDIDFGARGEIPHGESSRILNQFNAHVRGFFHWSIESRLHEAMGPQPVDK